MQTLGKYRILSELGKGGFATVCRAEDTTLGREVALKVLDPLLMRDTAWVERFRQEARAVAALDHPAIVTVHEIAEAEGRLFIAMKLIRGPSLDAVLTERVSFPWEETQRIIRQVTTALEYAHGKGILHRDLKPGNILLDPQNGAVLTDFGFARLVGESSMSVSLSGGLVGTPSYIAPELWHNRPAGVQSDLYALGCILYELITGRKAFSGDTPPAVMMAHFQPFQVPETWPEGTPPGVADVLRRALAQNPSDRYASAGELLAALDALKVDPLAEPYAALQAALAAEEWDAALRLAENLRAQQPDYRDVAALAQQAQAGWDKTQRVQAAAPWKEQAQAALKAGQPAVAQAALAQWLKLTPEDETAQRMRAQLAREVNTPARPVDNKPEAKTKSAKPAPNTDLAGSKRMEFAQPVRSGDAASGLPTAPPRLPAWVWVLIAVVGLAGVFGLGALFNALTAKPLPTIIPTVTATWTPTLTVAPTSTPTATSTPTPTPAFQLGDTWTRPTDEMVMVYVPAGEFQMGSEDGYDYEKPVHTVVLDAFWIDRTEVTNAQYEKCVQAGACAASTFKDDTDYNDATQPVVGVDQSIAAAYCAWTGGQLPTEAQWEYAARGPENRVFPWGDTFDGTKLNYCDINCESSWAYPVANDGYQKIAPVGSYPNGASWVGALDMAGNAAEWVVAESGYIPPRAIRGGSWNSPVTYVRSSCTSSLHDYPTYVGFRCVVMHVQGR